MSSATGKRVRSAAWRVSLWGTLWWACGTLVVFVFLHHSVAMDTQQRTDTWVAGEAQTMSTIALRTPRDKRYQVIMREIEEAASREMPGLQYDGDRDVDEQPPRDGQNYAVFFMETNPAGAPVLWAGPSDGGPYLAAIRKYPQLPAQPFNIHLIKGDIPYRVSAVTLPNGGHMFLGISERGELHALQSLLILFLLLWALNVLFGFSIIFVVTRRVLKNVQRITLAASQIGESDLSERVPSVEGRDEVGELAATLNRMLERIHRSVVQLRTITGSLAHDLRSPLTAVRAKLEMSLVRGGDPEAVESAIEEIDRLTEMLSQTLDVAEAEAGALRLERRPVDLEALLARMVELYTPSMDERGLTVQWRSAGPVEVYADESLLHRVLANLFDNEMKHLVSGATVCVCLARQGGKAVLVLEDNGPGFAPEVVEQVFQRGVKGSRSHGHGLGLAFVEAVIAVHGGSVVAENRSAGGARLRLELPLEGEVTPADDALCTGEECLCSPPRPQLVTLGAPAKVKEVTRR